MADQHATTGDAITHAIDKASDGLAQIAHTLSSAAPQAWAMAVHGVYAQGLAALVVGGLTVFFALVSAASCGFFAWRADKASSDAEGFFGFCAVVSGVAAVILFVVAGLNLCDASAWARVISPDGFLAQQILSKAL